MGICSERMPLVMILTHRCWKALLAEAERAAAAADGFPCSGMLGQFAEGLSQRTSGAERAILPVPARSATLRAHALVVRLD